MMTEMARLIIVLNTLGIAHTVTYQKFYDNAPQVIFCDRFDVAADDVGAHSRARGIMDQHGHFIRIDAFHCHLIHCGFEAGSDRTLPVFSSVRDRDAALRYTGPFFAHSGDLGINVVERSVVR